MIAQDVAARRRAAWGPLADVMANPPFRLAIDAAPVGAIAREVQRVDPLWGLSTTHPDLADAVATVIAAWHAWWQPESLVDPGDRDAARDLLAPLDWRLDPPPDPADEDAVADHPGLAAALDALFAAEIRPVRMRLPDATASGGATTGLGRVVGDGAPGGDGGGIDRSAAGDGGDDLRPLPLLHAAPVPPDIVRASDPDPHPDRDDDPDDSDF